MRIFKARRSPRDWRLAAGLCALLPSLALSATDDFKTEEGLRAALAPFEARYEAACRANDQAAARLAAEAGSKEADAAWVAARRSLAEVVSDPALEPILKHWSARRTVTRDPSLTRRVRLWSAARLVASVELEPEVRSLAESLARRLRQARPEGPKPALAASLSADMRRLIRLRDDVSRRRGQNYYHDMVYAANAVRPYWLAGVMETVAARSAPAWEPVVASLQQSWTGKSLRAADLEAALARRGGASHVAPIEKTFFPPGEAAAGARGLLIALGFTPEELGPDPPDTGAGVELALRAWSRALWDRRAAGLDPILKGHRWIPGLRNGPYAEGLAAFFAGLARDPLFLTGRLGMPVAQAEAWIAYQRDRQLLVLRRILGDAQSEFAFYINPDADLDARYGALLESALRLPLTPPEKTLWAIEARLVEEPLQASYAFMGLAIGAELQRRFVERFGPERFTSGKAAAWIKDEVLSGGELLALDDRLAKAAQGGYDFDRYLETLGIARKP